MNFEAKHLIRWGIPGWLYITIIFSYFIIERKQDLISYLSSFNMNNIGITALLAGGGIVIGHLIHQFSMLFGFLIWNQWRKYFNDEYKLDKIIMNNQEVGGEIQRIYSHRLGQVHALRALLTSNILSILTLIPLVVFYSFSLKTLFILGINILLIIVSYINHLYFKRNLDFFVKKVENDGIKCRYLPANDENIVI